MRPSPRANGGTKGLARAPRQPDVESGDQVLDALKGFAVFRLDVDGTIRSWNAGAVEMNGYTREEILGQPFERVFPPEDVTAGKPACLLRVAAERGHVDDEGWHVRKDGRRFWAGVAITALRDEHGALRGFVVVTRDLTEGKRGENLLQQSEQRLRLMVDSVKDYAIFMLDPAGIIISWNQGAKAIKGYEPHEIIGQSFRRFYTERDRAADLPGRLLDDAARFGRVENEGWRLRKDGTKFWADVVLTAVRDEDGKLRGFVKVTRDLSERKRTDERLRESEQRQRLMISSVADYAIFMLDPTGRVTSWNAGAERLKGYAPHEIIGQHFSRFYTPDAIAAHHPARELEIATREGRFEEEGWRVRKDGSRFWANVVLSAVRDEKGKLLGYTKVTRDMTERRRVQEELAARARQQAAVAELGLHALRTREPRAVMARAAIAAANTLGVDLVELLEWDRSGQYVLRAGVGYPEELVGKSFPATAVPDAAAVFARREPLVVEDVERDPRIGEGALAREQGARSGVTVVVHAPERDEPPYAALGAHSRAGRKFSDDDVYFLQALANVVAASFARERMESQLRAAEQHAQEERLRTLQAQAALRERDEFISIAAHELRTPLAALQLKVQGLDRLLRKTAAPPDATLATRVEGAVRQTHRLGSLVERLLDVSRISAGRLELSTEQFDLAALVQQVADDFREPASQAGSELHVSAPQPVQGTWDRFRMEQVVVNLLSNAVKYGSGQPIEVRVDAQNGRARLEVVDRGIGIPSSAVERIFARFERAAPLQNYGGMGLGLYITRHIVEAHGGSVRVTSKEGSGSTFVVEVPLASTKSAGPPAASA